MLEAGGPVRRMCEGSLLIIDLINSFLRSGYPTILEKNFSSGGRISTSCSMPNLLNRVLNNLYIYVEMVCNKLDPDYKSSTEFSSLIDICTELVIMY